jgi:hypothetical protein
MKRIILIAAIALLCAAIPSRAQDAHPQDVSATGAWQGTLNVFGTSMRLTLRVAQDDKGALSGVISSPDMGVGGTDVSSVKQKKTSLKFDIPAYNGSFEGKISDDGQTILGTWYIGEQSLPITFKRLAAAAPPPTSNVPRGVRAVGPEPGLTGTPSPTTVAPKIPVVEDLWLGTYQTPSGSKLTMRLHVSHDASGALSVKMDSINESVNGIRTSNASMTDTSLHFEIPEAAITYTGTLNSTHDEMTGPFSRSGGAQPLTFKRSSPAAPKSPEK